MSTIDVHHEEDRGPSMWTGGGYFYPFTPRAGEVRLPEIARALSRIPRFCGHTERFYSVAEHSLHCAAVAFDDPRGEDAFALARLALMHDAAEAYVGDLVRPIKSALREFRALEKRVFRAIEDRFGLATSWEAQERIHAIDNEVLAAEKLALLPEAPEWPNMAAPASISISCHTTAHAERLFLAKALELGIS